MLVHENVHFELHCVLWGLPSPSLLDVLIFCGWDWMAEMRSRVWMGWLHCAHFMVASPSGTSCKGKPQSDPSHYTKASWLHGFGKIAERRTVCFCIKITVPKKRPVMCKRRRVWWYFGGDVGYISLSIDLNLGKSMLAFDFLHIWSAWVRTPLILALSAPGCLNDGDSKNLASESCLSCSQSTIPSSSMTLTPGQPFNNRPWDTMEVLRSQFLALMHTCWPAHACQWLCSPSPPITS